jgi:hypothetical protein
MKKLKPSKDAQIAALNIQISELKAEIAALRTKLSANVEHIPSSATYWVYTPTGYVHYKDDSSNLPYLH